MVEKAKEDTVKAEVKAKASTKAEEKDIVGMMEKEMVGSHTKAKAKVEAEEKGDTADVDLVKARKEKEEKEKEEKEKESVVPADIVEETTTRANVGTSQATMMRCR